jgi:hypothetical protein
VGSGGVVQQLLASMPLTVCQVCAGVHACVHACVCVCVCVNEGWGEGVYRPRVWFSVGVWAGVRA